MKLDIYTMNGKKTGEQAELPKKVFEAPINRDLMHQAYVRQMANGRAGTHSTKVRSEVRGGGRKPWRQKGTGRARQGSIRAAQWVGGGKIHTPHPRDYTQKMPQKMRQAALRSALSVKAADDQIVLVDDLKLPEAKTRLMAEALQALVEFDSVLVLLPEKDEQHDAISLATRNLNDAKTLQAGYLNVRDLLGYDRLIMPVKALDVIKGYLG